MDKVDIDKLKTYIKEAKEELNMFGNITTLENDLKRTERLIKEYEKIQQENKEKDKQIEELVKYIDNNNYVDSEECQFQYDFKIDKCIEKGDCKDCIKQHFKNMIN